MDRFKKHKGRWSSWSDMWEEIYDYVLPHRESFFKKAQQLDVPRIYTTRLLWLVFLSLLLVYNLASFLPNGRAFRLLPGPEFPAELRSKSLEEELDRITDLIHEGLRNSNFNAEMHEGLQDLGLGTMNLLAEEGRFMGDLHFTSVPPTNLALLPGKQDTVTDWFRWNYQTDLTEVKHRYPKAKFTEKMLEEQRRDPNRKTRIVEATMYDATNRFKDEYTYYLISETDQCHSDEGEAVWLAVLFLGSLHAGLSLVLRYGAVVLCYRQCQQSRPLT